MRVSIIRVSRDTGVCYYPPRGDANRTYYSSIATQYFSVSVWLYAETTESTGSY